MHGYPIDYLLSDASDAFSDHPGLSISGNPGAMATRNRAGLLQLLVLGIRRATVLKYSLGVIFRKFPACSEIVTCYIPDPPQPQRTA
jgi:hypothetical protein